MLEPPEAVGRVYEVGGPEVLRYSAMLRRVAAIENRPLLLLPVPLLSPSLSSLWLTLVTDIDPGTGRALVDSMAMRSGAPYGNAGPGCTSPYEGDTPTEVGFWGYSGD